MEAVIFAGGGGTRLWPLSREKFPKQVCCLLDNETLLQKTFRRIDQVLPRKNIYVATNIKYLMQVKSQLPKLHKKNIFLEPTKRDTAAAIGLATFILAKENPESSLVTVWADAFLKNEKRYIKILKIIPKVLDKFPDRIVCVGEPPAYPETGYGYIERERKITQINREPVYKVKRFLEKPSLPRAKKFYKSGKHYWNIGLFAWKLQLGMSLFKKHLPQMFFKLSKIQSAWGTKKGKKTLDQIYPHLQATSIDYGIIEKTKNLVMLEGRFQWSDVGHFRAVKDILSKSSQDDLVRGRCLSLDSEGNLVFADCRELVAIIGLKNMIVVDTDDVLLICPKERAQDVKKIVEKLKKKGYKKYL